MLQHYRTLSIGHGCFNQYLFKMKIKTDPRCSHCSHGRNDGPQHTFFECEAWQQERNELVQSLELIGVQEPLSPPNLVPIMLISQETWNLISAYASVAMKWKMEAEWARKRAEHQGRLTPYVFNPRSREEEGLALLRAAILKVSW